MVHCGLGAASRLARSSRRVAARTSNRHGPAAANRTRRGQDVETDIRIDFAEAVHGATVPLRLSSPATCETCHGSGAKPGTSPRTCPTCNGNGLVTRNQGAFAFSEPCKDCRGTGQVVDDPCPDCRGTGVTRQTRTITVRIPPGVKDVPVGLKAMTADNIGAALQVLRAISNNLRQ